jgi:hypothetical protein
VASQPESVVFRFDRLNAFLVLEGDGCDSPWRVDLGALEGALSLRIRFDGNNLSRPVEALALGLPPRWIDGALQSFRLRGRIDAAGCGIELLAADSHNQRWIHGFAPVPTKDFYDLMNWKSAAPTVSQRFDEAEAKSDVPPTQPSPPIQPYQLRITATPEARTFTLLLGSLHAIGTVRVSSAGVL